MKIFLNSTFILLFIFCLSPIQKVGAQTSKEKLPPIVLEAVPLKNSNPVYYKKNQTKKSNNIPLSNGQLIKEREIPNLNSSKFSVNSKDNAVEFKITTSEGWVHHFEFENLIYDDGTNGTKQIVFEQNLNTQTVAFFVGVTKGKENFQTHRYACFDLNISKDKFTPLVRIYQNQAVNCQKKVLKDNTK